MDNLFLSIPFLIYAAVVIGCIVALFNISKQSKNHTILLEEILKELRKKKTEGN